MIDFNAFKQIHYSDLISDDPNLTWLLTILWEVFMRNNYVEDEEVNAEFLKLIDSVECDLNGTDMCHDTLLSTAAMKPQILFVVDYLLKRPEINVNKVNDLGFTALGMAVRYGNIECAKLLANDSRIKLSKGDKKELSKHGCSSIKGLIKYLSKDSESMTCTETQRGIF